MTAASSSVAARSTTLSANATASFADLASDARTATSASIAGEATTLSTTATASFADVAGTSRAADSASVAARATTLSADATSSYALLASDARTADSASVASRATTLSADATASFADLASDARTATSASISTLASTLSATATSSFSNISTLSRGGSGSFSGSFEGDGAGLTGVAPLAGTGVTVVGTTVSIGQSVATNSNVVFGTVTADTGTFVYQIFESASTIITSGSNIFGDTATDIQQITGSLITTGSITVVGAISASGTGLFSGLGIGTAASGTVGAILATNDVVAFASSDERLKENITLITSALDKVKAIRGVEFDWIANEEIHPNNGHDIGVIAQEVEAVLPIIVQTRENGYKAVKYEKLTALLIEAVKELSAKVDAHKCGCK